MKEKEVEIKFEKALAELKGIVSKLEGGDLELDESLKLFERGVKLIQLCSKKLDDAQRRVDIVMKSKDGKKVLKEYEEEGSAEKLDDDEEGELEEEEKS
jgi:exodeoxyribonuclease VII small subunit